MAVYTRGLTQAATYFPPAGVNGFGDPQHGAPVAVVCRWQDKAVLFRDEQGREVTSEAVVYVSQAVEVGGRIGLGALTDPAKAREIRQAGSSPSLRGGTEIITAWL
ncbi:hypothetical protein [Rhodovulum sulfidophilum]|uniref:hypothetical protein n=1 Tax=Rhodovulum sulfidophilum TaxID=35806 RepID=UPI001F344B73|nr:hypothetical protein [Rhodovulum sulfidophilum]MCE8418555.1 hypothetical protein [Rhodovulum sulfidophilum]MCE8440040.1 hypothetical protein [Rhodovulum sulfidophilum]MCE8471504.1 hypothetical protein [Rhodovulum sulfidophilum]